MTIQFNSSIPVINLEDFTSQSSSRKMAFIEKMQSAFREVGFAAVLNTKLNQEKRQKAYDVARTFFSLPKQAKEKMKSSTNSGERGYVNVESPKESGIQSKDTKEFLHIGKELPLESRDKLEYPENIWPEEMDLKSPMIDLYNDFESTVSILGEAISLALGESEDFLSIMTLNGDHLLRVLHYPSVLSKQENWAAAHTDLNLFTLLPPATQEGLQVQTKEGEWVNVTVPEGSLIVNVGDMLQNLTNGYFKSALHRVVPNQSGKDRYSIVLFAHTRNECLLSPLPIMIKKTGGEKKYPDATRKELLEYYLVALGRASKAMQERVVGSEIVSRISQLNNPHAEMINKKVIQIINNNLSL